MGDVSYSIREARWSDCGAMAHKLVSGRWLAYKQSGIDPRAQLRGLWGASLARRSCLIDGRLVAMWGLTGSILARSGHVWLVIAPEAARHPQALMREVRAQLAEFCSMKRELRATIAEQDGTALAFAKRLGFREETDEEGRPERVQVAQSSVYILNMILGG